MHLEFLNKLVRNVIALCYTPISGIHLPILLPVAEFAKHWQHLITGSLALAAVLPEPFSPNVTRLTPGANFPQRS